jgi:hypothetical protein
MQSGLQRSRLFSRYRSQITGKTAVGAAAVNAAATIGM